MADDTQVMTAPQPLPFASGSGNQNVLPPGMTPAAPAAPQQQPQQPQQQQQPQNPAVVQQAHTNRLGALAKSLLGKQYDYQVDPKTGQTVQVEQKQSPGELFRHLVAGALLGGAAAAEHPSGTGFLGGFATGGNAAHQADLQQDQQRRGQAQQQFQNQQETQKMGMEQEKLGLEKSRLEQEQIFQKAQIAQWTANSLRADKEADFQTEKFLQEQNQYNTNIQVELGKMGASPMPIMVDGKNINGQMDNGAEIQKYMSDPKNRQAPEGYSTLPIMTIDTTGLHRDGKTNQWSDVNGNPVSLNDRATWSIYQVPQNTLGAPVKVKGSVLNKLTGSDLPGDATYNMPLSDYIGLNTQAKARNLQQQAQDRADKHAELQASFDAAKITRDTANDQLRAAQATGDSEGMKTANDKLNEANEEMQRVADQMNPQAAVAREKAKAEKTKTSSPQNVDALRAKAPWTSITPGYVAVFDTSGNFKGQALPGKAPAGMIEVPPKAAAPITPDQQKEAEDLQNSQPTP